MKMISSRQATRLRSLLTTNQLILSGLIVIAATAATGLAQTTTNPLSPNFHTVDGQFNALSPGEWSTATPSAFISAPGGTATPTTFADPNKNSLLWAELGRTSPTSKISLFLLYDFLPRTPMSPIQPGELFASITFPVTLPPFPLLGIAGGNDTLISVLFSGGVSATSPPPGNGFFDIFVDLNLDGSGDVPASSLGIGGAVGFGPSPLSPSPHLLVELDVPLQIPTTFGVGGPLNPTGNGINPGNGLYDPDPAFWGAAAGTGERSPAGNVAPPAVSLQSASAATFTINPSGSITVDPTPVPEPHRRLCCSRA